MTGIALIICWVAIGLLAVTAVLAAIRVVRGPTILDRMIASDVLLTTLLLGLGTEMVINRHTTTLVLMLSIAAVAVFATIAVARYVSKQDRTSDAPITHTGAVRLAVPPTGIFARPTEGSERVPDQGEAS